MKALITGASSGIGKEMARILSRKGYDLIIVARRKQKLEELKEELHTNVEIIQLDISSTYNCMKLYEKVKKENIDILINNAGFGVCGEFATTSLDKELDMLDLNIKTTHTLTKLFLNDFIKKDKGYILNVASSAAFSPGPLMSSYYASKAFVLRLTQGIQEEIRQKYSNVYIGALCPGPINTEFSDVANVKFKINSLESKDVAEYAIKKMFQKKPIIIPGLFMKINYAFNRFLTTKQLSKIIYNIQKKEVKKEG